MKTSEYRGEVRPRRSPTRHHIVMSSATHMTKPVSDPFPPLSSKQFPSLYVRNPIRNQYRHFMRVKSPYRHG